MKKENKAKAKIKINDPEQFDIVNDIKLLPK